MRTHRAEPVDEIDEGLHDAFVMYLLDDEHRQRLLVPVEPLTAGICDRPATEFALYSKHD